VSELRGRIIATALALGIGGSTLLGIGCGEGTEVAGVGPVNCEPHRGAHTDSGVVSAMPRGREVRIPRAIIVNNDGGSGIAVTVTSNGNGNFQVNPSPDGTVDDHIPAIDYPTWADDRAKTQTIFDQGGIYTFTGTPGPHDTTDLAVTLGCS
jgi:hypothetical protein